MNNPLLGTLREIPLTLYRSEDKDAPQITGNMGELKNVLKACLSTGYGDKLPLGWNIAFEDTYNAAFVPSEPTANGHYCFVQNGLQQTAGRVFGLEKNATAEDFKTACAAQWGSLKNVFHGMNNFNFWLPYANNRNTQSRWLLLGHGKAFFFWVQSANKDNHNYIYFGDVPSMVAGDMFNTLCSSSSSSSSASSSSSSSSSYYYTEIFKNTFFARHWNQIDKGVTHIPAAKTIVNMYDYNTSTPQVFVDDCYLLGNGIWRGYLSGIYMCSHRLNHQNNHFGFSTLPGLENFLQCNNYDKPFFVKADSWPGV